MYRRKPGRVLSIAIALFALLGFAPAVVAAGPAAVEQAKIVLVAEGDNGQTGIPVGCGDSLVPVTVEVPDANTTAGKITQALIRLFSIKTRDYGQSGLTNALYNSNLMVDDVEIQGSTAAIYLTGTISLAGVCDDPRAEGQIVETAKQVAGITNAIVILNGGPISSPAGSIDFPQTGHSVAAPFFPYWEIHGGLPIFGYPLTDQFVEGGRRVQYFERQRFEHHPQNQAPYNILFGLVGRQTAQNRGLLGTAPFAPATQKNQAGCQFFAETRHNVCGKFLVYWHAHGLDFGEPGYSARESLALFGFPIGEEFQETIDGKTYTVQYFERVRMELHPENQPPYDVLLGRLTADLVP